MISSHPASSCNPDLAFSLAQLGQDVLESVTWGPVSKPDFILTVPGFKALGKADLRIGLTHRMDSEASGSVVVRIPEAGDAQLYLCMLLGEEAEQRDKEGWRGSTIGHT